MPKISKTNFVVSRLIGVNPVKGGQTVLWMVFRGGKHVKGAAGYTKAAATAVARRLAKKAGVPYWVERKAGGYDKGNAKA